MGTFVLEGMNVEDTLADLSARRCPRCKLPILIDEHHNIAHVAPDHESACEFLKDLTRGARA